MADSTAAIVDFLQSVIDAIGIETPIDVEQTPEGPRINLSGEQAELLVRHRGEPLKALQHVVDMAFARDLPGDQRVFIDALGYRKGKDSELKQMAKYLASKAKETGATAVVMVAHGGMNVTEGHGLVGTRDSEHTIDAGDIAHVPAGDVDVDVPGQQAILVADHRRPSGDAHLGEWPATLGRLRALKPEKMVPGRGPARSRCHLRTRAPVPRPAIP